MALLGTVTADRQSTIRDLWTPAGYGAYSALLRVGAEFSPFSSLAGCEAELTTNGLLTLRVDLFGGIGDHRARPEIPCRAPSLWFRRAGLDGRDLHAERRNCSCSCRFVGRGLAASPST